MKGNSSLISVYTLNIKVLWGCTIFKPWVLTFQPCCKSQQGSITFTNKNILLWLFDSLCKQIDFSDLVYWFLVYSITNKSQDKLNHFKVVENFDLINTSKLSSGFPTIDPSQDKTPLKNAKKARKAIRLAAMLATRAIAVLAPLAAASIIFLSFLQDKDKVKDPWTGVEQTFNKTPNQEDYAESQYIKPLAPNTKFHTLSQNVVIIERVVKLSWQLLHFTFYFEKHPYYS